MNKEKKEVERIRKKRDLKEREEGGEGKKNNSIIWSVVLCQVNKLLFREEQKIPLESFLKVR